MGQSVDHNNVTRAHQYEQSKGNIVFICMCQFRNASKRLVNAPLGPRRCGWQWNICCAFQTRRLRLTGSCTPASPLRSTSCRSTCRSSCSCAHPRPPTSHATALLPAATLHSRCAAPLQRSVFVPCRSCRPKSQQLPLSSLTSLSLCYTCAVLCHPLKP